MSDRTPGLAERVAELGRLVADPPSTLTAAELTLAADLLRRAGRRLALGAGFTVVALAGGSGGGKSALFNALLGLPLSVTGLRRPTTTEPVAGMFGDGDANPLLDWLAVPPRQRMPRASALDPTAGANLAGLILVDLPDHDTVRGDHRATVDDIVGKADAVVWVTDPQKYADALGHERYLRRLSHHEAVVVVAVNRIDELPPATRPVLERDLRRLLAADGLGAADVVLTSAATGDGVARLRELLHRQVEHRRAVEQRIGADLDAFAARLRQRAGRPPTPRERASAYDALVDEVFAALGGPAVAAAAVDGRPLTAAIRPVAWEPLALACASRIAAGLPPQARNAVAEAADRSSVAAPARLAAAISAVDVAGLRPRRRLLGGRARRRQEHIRHVADATRSATSDALAPVRAALDEALRPWQELAASADAIAGAPAGAAQAGGH